MAERRHDAPERTPALLRFQRGHKYKRCDEWTASAIAMAPAPELEMLLEIEPRFVYRLGRGALRTMRRRNRAGLGLVLAAIEQLTANGLGPCPAMTGEAYLEPTTLLSDADGPVLPQDWLTELGEFVRALRDGESPPRAASKARTSASEVGMAAAARADGSPAKADSMAPAAVNLRTPPRTPAFPQYLPELRPGQFQLPDLFTRAGLATIGAPGKTRETYTVEAPRHVLQVSGQPRGQTTVTYIGEELRTGDIETWAVLLMLVASLHLGSRVVVSARELLRMLRRGTGGPAYECLRQEVLRLQGALLVLRSSDLGMLEQFRQMFPDDPLAAGTAKGPLEVSFHLLGPSSTDGNRWSVFVPPEVRVAFGPGVSSWFNLDRYFELARRRHGDTVRRLHLFYGSHPKPWPFTAEELHGFLGSTMSRMSDWRRSLEQAHDALLEMRYITGWRLEPSERRGGKTAYVVEHRR